MFLKCNVLNGSSESEERVIHTSHIEELYPLANVNVNPGSVSTACCGVRFLSGTVITVLIDYAAFYERLNVVEGILEFSGNVV